VSLHWRERGQQESIDKCERESTLPQRAKLISTYQESRENRHPILYITTRNKEEGKGEEDKDDEGIGGTTTIMDEENNSNTSSNDQLQVLLFIALHRSYISL
jgi:hypothetical protein